MAALIRLSALTLGLGLSCGSAAQQSLPAPFEPAGEAGMNITRWKPMITQASEKFVIPQSWIEAVMMAESGGRTHLAGRPIVSRAGAMGLMQLMPRTWTALRIQYGLGSDPHDPRDNIIAGTAYLRAMYDRFGYPGLFAAYNAGPARYADHLRTGGPLPSETRAYVAQLVGSHATVDRPWPDAVRSGLFFAIGTRSAAVADRDDGWAEQSVFASLRPKSSVSK